MIFATYWFLAFAILFFPIFWLCRRPTLRLGLILVVSAIFHTHYAGPAGVMPIVAMGVIVYFIGLSDNRAANAVGIILCVLMLVGYKYLVFLSANLLGMFHAELGTKVSAAMRNSLPETPPLAISFFTFEFVHYLVDRRRGTFPIRRPTDFALFAIFFPTLVAGPIKRYEQFLPSLRAGVASVCTRDVMTGLLQASLGCVKKVCADNLTIWLDHSQDRFTSFPLADRWMLFAAVAFRILLDFSGYSDIAIGLARMMGVAIPANFNWPYLATNIREFWHRWHISLSTWIRDYIYIPLGGSRHGNFRRFLNGLAAFSLCGLWHGAGWNFVLWGLYHGLGLSISHFYGRVPFGIGGVAERVFKAVPFLGWIVTVLFVWLGWLLFFYPVTQAWQMAVHLFIPARS